MAEIVSKKDVGLEPNIVVSGEQKGEFVIERHRELYVGNKVLSNLTCEGFEDISSEYAGQYTEKLRKEIMPFLIGTAIIPFGAPIVAKKLIDAGNMLKIKWRNGTESVIFVSIVAGKKIEKMFY